MGIETVRNRIKERIEVDPQLSTRGLARAAGIQDGTLRAFMEGTTKSLSFDNVSKVAGALGVSINYLNGDDERPGSDTPKVKGKTPLLGFAATNFASGKRPLASAEIGWVPNPPALNATRDVFAFFMPGDSLSPKYESGTLCFASPHFPVRHGDGIFVREKDKEGKVFVSVGIFAGNSEKSVTLKKIHPTEELIEIANESVINTARIFTTNELFGV